MTSSRQTKNAQHADKNDTHVYNYPSIHPSIHQNLVKLGCHGFIQWYSQITLSHGFPAFFNLSCFFRLLSISIQLFFCPPPSSAIASCVGTVDTVMDHSWLGAAPAQLLEGRHCFHSTYEMNNFRILCYLQIVSKLLYIV